MALALSYTHVDSPVGPLLLAGDTEALHVLRFPGRHGAAAPRPEWRQDAEPFREIERQLAAYFQGELRRFDVPFHLRGSPFQEQVWRILAEIPFGETRSYGAIAAMVGAPGAAQAVGRASGDNPLPIILPCHRVIGSDGSLTGFGGGLPVKRFLLRLEGNAAGAEPAQLSLF
ncbi:methylated-DNA--[protein]-cysteine S-methyltransferase [Jiella sp. M17.18]|uniref:methylated-DNA--[protein]-cysteine S-methyltransferase n=1 Tax=Jiella sp. M17.18 TaxID=3234247 RepID=UPI0034DFCA1A